MQAAKFYYNFYMLDMQAMQAAYANRDYPLADHYRQTSEEMLDRHFEALDKALEAIGWAI